MHRRSMTVGEFATHRATRAGRDDRGAGYLGETVTVAAQVALRLGSQLSHVAVERPVTAVFAPVMLSEPEAPCSDSACCATPFLSLKSMTRSSSASRQPAGPNVLELSVAVGRLGSSVLW